MQYTVIDYEVSLDSVGGGGGGGRGQVKGNRTLKDGKYAPDSMLISTSELLFIRYYTECFALSKRKQ